MSFIKLFFNILKSHKINFILPLAIVLVFSVINTKLQNNNVSEYNPSVYVIDNDNTEFSKKLTEEIDKHADIEKYNDNVDLEQELMSSYVSAYIEIPAGFTDKFNEYKTNNGEKFNSKNKIIIKCIENSNSGIYLDEKINNFLNAELNNSELKDEFLKLDISSALNSDNTDLKISILSFSAYGIIYGVLSVVGTYILLIRKKDIKDRYSCSPISNKKYLLQVTLSSVMILLVFSIVIATFVMNGLLDMKFDKIWLLNFINMLILGVFSLGVGLLTGMIAKGMEALNGIGNGVSLSLAFLGGLFVPIEVFSNTMKTISKFTPTYWYSDVTRTLISSSEEINMNSILSDFGIQCIFIVVIFILVAIISKKKQVG